LSGAKTVFLSHPIRLPGARGKIPLKATIKWTDQVNFVAETGSGHTVIVDGSPEAGGHNLGPRPMELVLAGTAACTAFDVVWILKKARQTISACVVEVEAERAPAEPKVFTRLHFIYRIRGEDLTPAQVERAVKLSKDKYCSATLMLAKTAAISYEISLNGETLPGATA
jgi:putative redox protein